MTGVMTNERRIEIETVVDGLSDNENILVRTLSDMAADLITEMERLEGEVNDLEAELHDIAFYG